MMRFGAAPLIMIENRATLAVLRVWQGFVILLLALVPVSGLAQTGREFVSAEAYVGLARIVHVGKIVELKQAEYEKPLTANQKIGKPYRLVFKVSETIRGNEVEHLELVLSLQSIHFLEYMRDQSAEIILAGGPNRLGDFPRPEQGIEEQGKRVDGQWYQFRLLDPVKVPESAPGAEIARQLNTYYDFGRMFTNKLKIVAGREAILKRARVFAKENTKMLSAVFLIVPNEFGSLCGSPNAYCGITLPICPSTKKALADLKADPGRILRRIKFRDEGYSRSHLLAEIDKALGMFPNPDQDKVTDK